MTTLIERYEALPRDAADGCVIGDYHVIHLLADALRGEVSYNRTAYKLADIRALLSRVEQDYGRSAGSSPPTSGGSAE